MEQQVHNVKRRYDGRRRSQQAERTKHDMLRAADRLLLSEGYAATSVARVAREVDVSVEAVYKAFGNKPRLVYAVVQRALAGEGPLPAEARSDALHATEPDARAVIHGWVMLTTEVAPRVAPILLVLRAGAMHDSELAALRDELENDRYNRMLLNAGRLLASGELRPELDEAHVAAVLWTYTAPELYELLVERRDWTPERFSRFVEEALTAHLLPLIAQRSVESS